LSEAEKFQHVSSRFKKEKAKSLIDLAFYEKKDSVYSFIDLIASSKPAGFFPPAVAKNG
jgi:F0F1-type ATP synthase delta subunit